MKYKLLLLTAYCLLITLAACGFKPIYAQHETSALSQIYVSEIENREGQVLRSHLQDLLAAHGRAYTLKTSLFKERREFGIQQDLRVSRYDISMTAEFVLIDNASGEEILRDKAKVYSSFNRTDSEFSTFVAEEDATEKAAEELAFAIRNKLASFFDR